MAPRIRTYDAAKIRAAVTAQFGHIADAVRELTPEQLGRDSGLGDWTVADLAAHIAWIADSLAGGLARPPAIMAELTAVEWPSATASLAGKIAEAAKETLDGAPPSELPELIDRAGARMAEALAANPGRRVLNLWIGDMTLADFLVTRTVELVVHTDDLNRAAGVDIPIERQALAACTRLLADALALKAPGGSVEVRIPPFAVVQCIEGPRHTRGTPPNVVESDPLTWIRLATGRTDWASAVEGAQVRASGERADLSALLPVMS
ncbi:MULTISPECIES: maleylpyruvate isomerase family mycothiol-dependent enzyme [unclassified Streptomyces]|uniref:maleylpyruvate isomerase family mycothiol-dependent enzyme n=1 Tax=unclassified Streptomyces TaxID=2593676 RepID=UPI001BE85DBF|nr:MULTISPECIES: maleylpyruvate isomerase family mycothiol-dependent enzyme [unclassified Streptomyces]MBT2403475.1 maleylpyruvate isomerase family mycothiol-dependent enzyme [Streptomyces sp. ISL-21]MBT2456788.1 maleylpyruvate isomerase family mycothiol-dependent enzyme [Streptomyces sp. ISL-86]MBT2612837.1 maleylpyruvate isomerase family mycothiol-dependent enzyme [Streptomyces sp. ISL-87]